MDYVILDEGCASNLKRIAINFLAVEFCTERRKWRKHNIQRNPAIKEQAGETQVPFKQNKQINSGLIELVSSLCEFKRGR